MCQAKEEEKTLKSMILIYGSEGKTFYLGKWRGGPAEGGGPGAQKLMLCLCWFIIKVCHLVRNANPDCCHFRGEGNGRKVLCGWVVSGAK